MSSQALQSTPAAVSSDLDDLQGDWLTIDGRCAGELDIVGHSYTVQFLDGTYYRGTFDLVLDPPAMIMHIEDGPPQHRGKTAWCLYALDVGLLRWCPTEPGSDERLSAFPDIDDPRYMNTIFRRDMNEPD